MAKSEQQQAQQGEVVRVSGEVIKAEAESMAAIARAYPRNESEGRAKILKAIAANKEEAARMLYRIPYKDRSGDQERTVWVEGLSVKAALLASRLWGNCTVGARIENESDDAVDIIGVFHDWETNYRIVRPLRVSKWIKAKRTGAAYRMSVDALTKAVQAGASKALRNSTLDGLPPDLRDAMFEKVKGLTAAAASAQGSKSRDEKIVACVTAFQKHGVTAEQLEAYVGGKLEAVPAEAFVTLRGILNALEDGETTVAEVFEGGAAAQPQAVEQAALPPELAGAAGTAKSKDEEVAAPPPQKPQAEPVQTVKAPEPKQPQQKLEPESPEYAAVIEQMRADLAALAEFGNEDGWMEWPNKEARRLGLMGWHDMKSIIDTYEAIGKARKWKGARVR